MLCTPWLVHSVDEILCLVCVHCYCQYARPCEFVCILVCVHALTTVHPCCYCSCYCVHLYVCTCCCVDLRLLCVSTGGLSVVFVHVQYVLFVVACSSSLLTSCICTLCVYRVCMSVCLFSFRQACLLPVCCEVWLWMFYCICLSTVHVSIVYFDYLCGYRYLFCRVVPLFMLIRSCDSYCLILVYSWLTQVRGATRF